MAKVSIVVPVHNTEKYLRTCVSSLLAQTLKDIEIILVENASTDNSKALCEALAEEDSRIRTISLEIGDVSTARNEGVKVATGDFVGFIDSDDTIAPEMYEKLYDAAIRHKAEVTFCNYMKVYPNLPDKHVFNDTGKEKVLSTKEALIATFKEKIYSACTFLVERSIALKTPFPEGRTIEDRATTYRFCAAVRKCVHVCQPLYFYHQYRGKTINNHKIFRHSSNWELADKEILEFISSYDGFTDKEKTDISTKISRSLVRQLNRMRRTASSERARAMYQERKKDLLLIPAGSLRHPLLTMLRFLMIHSIGKF